MGEITYVEIDLCDRLHYSASSASDAYKEHTLAQEWKVELKLSRTGGSFGGRPHDEEAIRWKFSCKPAAKSVP